MIRAQLSFKLAFKGVYWVCLSLRGSSLRAAWLCIIENESAVKETWIWILFIFFFSTTEIAAVFFRRKNLLLRRKTATSGAGRLRMENAHTGGGLMSGTIFAHTFAHGVIGPIRKVRRTFWWVETKAKRSKTESSTKGSRVELCTQDKTADGSLGTRGKMKITLRNFWPARNSSLYRKAGLNWSIFHP